jgi:hypothetical protein
MSGYTMTQGEVLYANVAQGTSLATFTTEASLLGGMILPVIPAYYFMNNTSVGRTIKVRASGIASTTTTGPTFTWFARLIPAGTAFSAGGGLLVAQTAALTAVASKSNARWFIDLDIVMQNVNPGATSVIGSNGELRAYSLLSATANVCTGAPMAPVSTPDASATFTVSTYDSSVNYNLYLSAACGTSNASNSIALQMMKVYGEN